MSTRREFTQTSMAALFVAFLAAFTADAGDRQPYPFEEWAYEGLAIRLMVTTGLDAETPEGDAMMRLLMFGQPLPEEFEWARDRCRHALETLSGRLEATQ